VGVWVCVCGCVGVWVCGYVRVWVCGCVGVCVQRDVACAWVPEYQECDVAVSSIKPSPVAVVEQIRQNVGRAVHSVAPHLWSDSNKGDADAWGRVKRER
jgi:hypothetical protein